MKNKIPNIILLFVSLFFIFTINVNAEEIDYSTAYSNTENHTHVWSAATCVKKSSCTVCGVSKGVKTEHSFKLVGNGNEQCSICGKIQEASTEVFKCDYCNQYFENQQIYEDHMTRHSDFKLGRIDAIDDVYYTQGETTYIQGDLLCPICLQYKYTTMSDYMNHVSSIHSISISCPYCDKTFTNYDDKNYHVNNVHLYVIENEKNFKIQSSKTWEEKAEEYAQWSHEISYEFIAQREDFEGFSCAYCGIKIMNYQAYLSHMQAEGSTIGLDIYTCSYCNTNFTIYEEFEKHYQKEYEENTKGMCPLCLKMFPNLTELRAHIDSEANIIEASMQNKSYVCSLCNNSYKTLEEAFACIDKDAKVLYPDVFKCTTCNKEFKSYEDLKAHADKVEAEYKEAVERYNAEVEEYNKKVAQHNAKVTSDAEKYFKTHYYENAPEDIKNKFNNLSGSDLYYFVLNYSKENPLPPKTNASPTTNDSTQTETDTNTTETEDANTKKPQSTTATHKPVTVPQDEWRNNTFYNNLNTNIRYSDLTREICYYVDYVDRHYLYRKASFKESPGTGYSQDYYKEWLIENGFMLRGHNIVFIDWIKYEKSKFDKSLKPYYAQGEEIKNFMIEHFKTYHNQNKNFTHKEAYLEYINHTCTI